MSTYSIGNIVVIDYDNAHQIGVITNIRRKKRKIIGYDIRTEKGSGLVSVPVDKQYDVNLPDIMKYASINSGLTAAWLNSGGETNLHMKRNVGHTRANYSDDITLREDGDGWGTLPMYIGQYEKYNDFLQPQIGPRSWFGTPGPIGVNPE